MGTLDGGGSGCSGVHVVRIAGGRFFIGGLDGREMVAALKALIAQQEGIPAVDQKLVFNGRCLADGETLSQAEISIERPSTLYLLASGAGGARAPSLAQQLPQGFEGVVVCTLGGERFEIEVDPSDTVCALKAKLHQHAGTPVCEQRLLFSGEELTEDCSLASKGISTRGGSTVHLLQQRVALRTDAAFGHVGSLVERVLDGVWFRAVVQRRAGHPAGARGPALTLKYLDDGKCEEGVPLAECRPVT